ncbi:MAG TPA: AmmeMemoRadiSam system protein B [Candidatus Hydrogenedentes bacterium]|nr:AmmeMemoRadiSam system protein B [Candidatus Hydrogenedentota bacterium]HPG65881.1 AmmeMemoRadiSam system protein B [Candidatus Hydrogenedentota bacterium]
MRYLDGHTVVAPAGWCAGASALRVVVWVTLLSVGVGLGAWLGRAWMEGAATAATEAEVETMTKQVFRSPLPGRWYEAKPALLTAEIDGFVEEATGDTLEGVIALVLPHAGYVYSGPTAGYGLRAIKGKHYRRVVVMGPTHSVPMSNAASVPTGYTHYSTPLGEVALDLGFMAALKTHTVFRSEPAAHAQEHSVQIELPLLQRVLGEFTLVPIVVGQLDVATAREMGRILAGLVDRETLVVVSTDFTHYGPRFGYAPFKSDVPESIKRLDMDAWAFAEKKDVEGFFGYVDGTGATICGRCPLGVLLAMLPADAEGHLCHYDSSGRMTGDYSNAVSYVSAAFTGAWPEREAVVDEETPDEAKASLSDEDKQALLKLARRTLEYYLKHKDTPTPEDLDVPVTEGMKQIMGAFVTLHEHGQLRGCIGEIVPRREVYKAVIDHAIDAGVNDYRFDRVQAKELPDLEFEISALTAPVPVGSYNEIVLGKHGMVLSKNGRSAVFLPQVAPEQGWDLATTLTHLSMKAGLPADAWREGATYTIFEALVFGEKE